MSSNDTSSNSDKSSEVSSRHDMEVEGEEHINETVEESTSVEGAGIASETSPQVDIAEDIEVEGTQSSAGNDDEVKFIRRGGRLRFLSSNRQYRRRNRADDSSGDERPPRENARERLDAELPPISEDEISSPESSDSSNSGVDEDVERHRMIDNAPMPKAMLKPKPSHKWFAVKEIIKREVGCSPHQAGSGQFQNRYYGSLHAVQRLELMYKLESHQGCVNSLHFNRSGELLISASDDKRIVLWDWAIDKSILSYESGHSANVFQAKFLPLSGDRHIVSCARDGQIRLGVLSGVGKCKDTTLLAEHSRPSHKLAVHAETPHVFLSCGEDGVVFSHDVRTCKTDRLLMCEEDNHKVGLFSIDINPVISHEFIVTGEDHFIRLYDRRKASVPVKKFCPNHFSKHDFSLHVTCAVFNFNGTEVVGSYNDDDMYLFDTRAPDGADYAHKYAGHRNSITVKGVNFFGPRSEFVVSGSDCGNIFVWDKSTEAIVQWMRGDEEGVVNCLQPHPGVPILATSGLDSDIKIWVPSCENEPTFEGLKTTVISNQADREQNVWQRSDPFDTRQMRWLWRQIQRFEEQRIHINSTTNQDEEDGLRSAPRTLRRESGNSSSSSGEESNSARSGRPQCSPS